MSTLLGSTICLAERFVQKLIQELLWNSESSEFLRLTKILFTCRITPHSATLVSPAALRLGRRVRFRLDLLKPSTASVVTHGQFGASGYPSTVLRSQQEGDSVLVRNHRGSEEKSSRHDHQENGSGLFQVCVKT